MSKVVSLRGDDIVGGGASEDGVTLLRKYLQQAEAGEIAGVAIAVTRPVDVIGTEWVDDGSCRFCLSAAVMALHGRVSASLAGHD